MNSNFFNNIQYPVSIERVGPLTLGNFPTPNHQPWWMYFLPPSHWHLSPLHTHLEGSGERTVGLALFSLCDNLCNFLKLKQIPVHLAAKRVAACVALHVINVCRELTLASPGLPTSAELLYRFPGSPHSASSPFMADPVFIHLIFPTPSCPPETRTSKPCPWNQTQRP